jgi:hypothetical protein
MALSAVLRVVTPTALITRCEGNAMKGLSTQFQPPLYWQQFEEVTLVVAKTSLSAKKAEKFGRPGQRQHGIDILVKAGGRLIGIQCKRLTKNSDKAGGPITEKLIREEAAKAETFPGKLDELIIATTAPSDTAATIAALKVGGEYLARDLFEVTVWSWDDFVAAINLHHRLKRWYYPAVIDEMSAANLDTLLVDGIRQAFNRPAFEVAMRHEQPAEFAQAIKDVQKQLRTGHLVDRETGLLMRQTLGGYDKLTSAALRKLAGDVDRNLRRLRAALDHAVEFVYDRKAIVSWRVRDGLAFNALESVRTQCVVAANLLFTAAGLDSIFVPGHPGST